MANSYQIAPDGAVAQPVVSAAGGNNYNVAKFATIPTITAGAYSAGQVVGGLITMANAAVNSGGAGIVQSIGLSDSSKQSAAIDVVFFSAAPSGTFTDAATFNPGAGDILKICGYASILGTSYSAFSANSFACLNNVGIAYVLGATSLYAVLVARGTPTYAATTALQLTVDLLQSG